MYRLLITFAFACVCIFAANTGPHNKTSEQRTKQRPVARGPGVLTAEQEALDQKAVDELESSLLDLNRFNTDGKSNAMPQTGERMPQSLPRSMNEASQ